MVYPAFAAVKGDARGSKTDLRCFGYDLCAANKEYPPEPQRVEKALVQVIFDLARKINHHVATDDQVKSALKSIVQKVMLFERDPVPQVFGDPIFSIFDAKIY